MTKPMKTITLPSDIYDELHHLIKWQWDAPVLLSRSVITREQRDAAFIDNTHNDQVTLNIDDKFLVVKANGDYSWLNT